MGSSGGGFGNLSLVGDGVLVWDDDVLGTDVSVRSSGFGGELGVGTVCSECWFNPEMEFYSA